MERVVFCAISSERIASADQRRSSSAAASAAMATGRAIAGSTHRPLAFEMNASISMLLFDLSVNECHLDPALYLQPGQHPCRMFGAGIQRLQIARGDIRAGHFDFELDMLAVAVDLDRDHLGAGDLGRFDAAQHTAAVGNLDRLSAKVDLMPA